MLQRRTTTARRRLWRLRAAITWRWSNCSWTGMSMSMQLTASARRRWEVCNVEASIPRALTEPNPERAIRAAVDWGEFVRFTGMGSTRPLEAARETATILDLTEFQADCGKRLGDIALDRSDHDNAQALCGTALEMYQRISEPYSIGWTKRRGRVLIVRTSWKIWRRSSVRWRNRSEALFGC